MQSYRNLDVWKMAHEFTLALYRDTGSFPSDERFGLRSQIRRAASSIGANIAEGCGRGSDGELRQSLQFAMGSATEVDNHLLLARDLGFIAADVYEARMEKVTRIQKMLSAFIVRLRQEPARRARSAATSA